jgi:hypothetical protein
VGIFYQAQQTPKGIVNQTTPRLLQQLHSGVIRAVSASGKVTSIFGRNITLNNAGQSLTVKVADNAQLVSFISAIPPSLSKTGVAVPASQKKIAFSDIKIGDNLTLSLSILPDNTLECTSVFSIPPNVINIK